MWHMGLTKPNHPMDDRVLLQCRICCQWICIPSTALHLLNSVLPCRQQAGDGDTSGQLWAPHLSH